MSKLIAVIGESGSGKTTSFRNLNPEETYYIDADGKGLCWRGWRNEYNTQRKNYYRTRSAQEISNILVGISQKRPNIHNIIIDTLNTVMVQHEISEMKNGGFGKWVELTQFVWELLNTAGQLREDINVIVTFHSETLRDEDGGYTFTRIRTNGRKLEKVQLETLFSTVLLTEVNDDGRHVFRTHADHSTAKTPFGAFEDDEIDNDMAAVLAVLSEF